MPRGRLNEKYIKQVAVDWIASYYRGREGVQAVVPETDVTVRAETRLGSGRADGLVAWQLFDGTIHTAAMEARSWRTLSGARHNGLASYVLAAGGIGLLVGLIGWYIGAWSWMWVFPILVFFGVGFAYLLSTLVRSQDQPFDAVQQVRRYPADESWIAVSADAYDELDPEEQHALQADCRIEGIGLLKIESVLHITPLEEPRSRRAPKAHVDYLACYARSTVVRHKLRAKAGKSKERRTKADTRPWAVESPRRHA